jgi:hypothetical protein
MNATRLAWIVPLAAWPAAALAGNDYPTNARVEYVVACMKDYPGNPQEALYKCSCAIDAIAERMTYEEWVDVSTVANAITIAGERGGVVRDMKDGRKIAATYRSVQEDARKRCFMAK